MNRHILRYEKGGKMNYENLKEDISNQIYNNSKLALIKNTLFKYALIIDIIAFASFVVYVLQVIGIVPS